MVRADRQHVPECVWVDRLLGFRYFVARFGTGGDKTMFYALSEVVGDGDARERNKEAQKLKKGKGREESRQELWKVE